LLAILIAGSICLYFYWQMQESQDLKLKKMSRSLLLLFIGGIAFGAATLLLLSPTWMKLTHLLIAQILWISFVGWHTLKSSTR